MNEPVAADQWIYSTLKADSTLTALIGGSTSPRIYNEQVPQNGTPIWPCVVYQMQSAVNLMIVGPAPVLGQHDSIWYVGFTRQAVMAVRCSRLPSA